MSKLNQIQSHLLKIGEGEFEKLCGDFLYLSMNLDVRTEGSVLGRNKTKKGTPDAFVKLPNGNYAFIEYTTQKTNVGKKFNDDLIKCFKKAKIENIIVEIAILCHNTRLSIAELEELSSFCKENKCKLEDIHIDKLAFAIKNDYPHLAKEYFGVEIDTHQILDSEQFISEYQKNSIATPLDNEFFAREGNIEEVLTNLQSSDIVILKGKPGVGKTKLALECSRIFSEPNPAYKVFCLLNKGASVIDDISAYFSRPGNYLVIVDDANRVTELEYIISKIRENTSKRHLKLLITVRDYALDKITSQIGEYLNYRTIEIPILEDKDIIKIISSEKFGVKNYQYHRRICNIAKGNARIAIMAALYAKNTPNVYHLHNVTDIYEGYFKPILSELKTNNYKKKLLVLGIISFFRVIQKDSDQAVKIYEKFNINEVDFWEIIEELHTMELVDIYENQIVKISDQVLSTYFFYFAFIKEELLDYSIILLHFFNKEKLIENLNPLYNTFDAELITKKIERPFKVKWNSVEDEEKLRVLEVFWFVNLEETLSYVYDRIKALLQDNSEYNFSEEPKYIRNPYLKILSYFSHEEHFFTALEIIFALLEKEPTVLSEVIYFLTHEVSFKTNSYDFYFKNQRDLFKFLFAKTIKPKQSELAEKLILRVSSHYLKTSFSETWGDGRTVSWQDFKLELTDEIKELRTQIWNFIFEQYNNSQNKEKAIAIIEKYTSSFDYKGNLKINKFDYPILSKFLLKSFDPANYHQCFIVHQYLKTLAFHKIKFKNNEVLKVKFTNKAFKIYTDLFKKYDRKEEKLTYDEHEQYIRKQVHQYFKDFTFNDYIEFLGQCEEIKKEYKSSDYQYQRITQIILEDLAKKDIKLCKRVLKIICSSGNTLELKPHFFLKVLLEQNPKEQRNIYNIISKNSFLQKENWLFSFFQHITVINKVFLRELYNLSENINEHQYNLQLNFLEKYTSLDKDVVVNVLKRLLESAESKNLYVSFDVIFHEEGFIPENLLAIFANHKDLLKRMYVHCDSFQSYFDYSSKGMRRVMELDENFIIDYLEFQFGKVDYVSKYDISGEYDFIWKMDNYEDIIRKVMHYLRQRPYITSWRYSSLFFIGKDDETKERIIDFLKKFVEENITDIGELNEIYPIIKENFPNHRREFVEDFLHRNSDPDNFERLNIGASGYSGNGSFIPAYEKEREFWRSLIPLVNGVDFIKQKIYINSRIDDYNKSIEHERKRIFMDVNR